jgi:hypothetical protein
MLAAIVKKGSKRCEDAASANRLEDAVLLQVSDGHGELGEECAAFCIQNGYKQVTDLPFGHREWTEEEWKTCADRHMDELHDSYRQHVLTKEQFGQKKYKVNDEGVIFTNSDMVVHGGATYTRVYVFPTPTGFRTVIFQVGDSNVFVNGECMSEDDSATSQKHYDRIKATIPENKRLLQVFDQECNKYQKYMCPKIFLEDGTRDPYYIDKWWNKVKGLRAANAKLDPSTYFVSQQNNLQTCIAMGSSIGDYYAHPQGITNRAIVKIIDTPTTPHIYLATDGATDLLNKENVWKSPSQGSIGGVDMKPFMEKYGLVSPSPSDVDIESRQEKVQMMLQEHVEKVHCMAGELFGMTHIDDISEVVLIP